MIKTKKFTVAQQLVINYLVLSEGSLTRLEAATYFWIGENKITGQTVVSLVNRGILKVTESSLRGYPLTVQLIKNLHYAD